MDNANSPSMEPDNPAMEPDDPGTETSFLLRQENQEDNEDQGIDYRVHYRAAKTLAYHTYNFFCLTPIGNYQANLQLNPHHAAVTGFKIAAHGLMYHIDHRTPSNVSKAVLDKRNSLRSQYLQLKVEDPQQYSDSDFDALACEMTGPLQVLFSALEGEKYTHAWKMATVTTWRPLLSVNFQPTAQPRHETCGQREREISVPAHSHL